MLILLNLKFIAPKHFQQSQIFKVAVKIKIKMDKSIILKIKNNKFFKNRLRTHHIINLTE